MEFNLEPMTIVISLGMYAFCMLVIWRLIFMGRFTLPQKIIVSAVMLPACYIITSIKMGD